MPKRAKTRPASIGEGDVFVSPLVTRNASRAMAELFSPRRRAQTWRHIWIALAETQHEMGLPVSAKQVAALRKHVDDVDLAAVAVHERRVRHDVMAHLHAFADQAPIAREILHLGATSMDVVDNADLLIMRDALDLVRGRLVAVVEALADRAKQYRNLACLGFTHYQPAQPTTVGKRAALWCWDFVRDLEEMDTRRNALQFRGMRGATGTQAGFLKLFGGNKSKVRELERRVADKLGFDASEPVTGQTYSRKVDAQIMAGLASIAAGVHKFANDIRLLANLGEVEEPFEKNQVGSSAMAYKRNPMLCERATGLARFVIALSQSAFQTAAEQWLERTLDDSSNKRIIVPEAFLAVDGMLQIVQHVAGGMVVHDRVIAARLDAEMPFMVTEDILMAAVAKGGDRQALHERIRVHSLAAAREMKEQGRPNDLLARLKSDAAFANVRVDRIANPSAYTGMAADQVDEFLKTCVKPILKLHNKTPRPGVEISV